MAVGWSGRRVVGLAVAAMLVAGAVSVTGQRPTVDSSMDALVAEIRALRQAVERSGIAGARAQVALGRLQLQENRLATLGRQALESRIRLQNAILQLTDTQVQVARLARSVDETVTAEQRREVEAALEERKASLKQLQSHVNQLRTEEGEASSALSAEQARWSDFNERLEALERALASPAPR